MTTYNPPKPAEYKSILEYLIATTEYNTKYARNNFKRRALSVAISYLEEEVNSGRHQDEYAEGCKLALADLRRMLTAQEKRS